MQASEAIFKIGFEQLGDVPFSAMDRYGEDRAGNDRPCRAIAASTAWFRNSSAIRGCASSLAFHPLLIGGNPFTASSIYCLIAFLERKWGVHFAMGGTGRLVAGTG